MHTGDIDWVTVLLVVVIAVFEAIPVEIPLLLLFTNRIYFFVYIPEAG